MKGIITDTGDGKLDEEGPCQNASIWSKSRHSIINTDGNAGVHVGKREKRVRRMGSSIEVSRENGRLVVKGGGDAATISEAVRAFVAAESKLPSCLSVDAIEEAHLAGKRFAWHPGYDRPPWPDKDPPLIVHVWRPQMLHPNCVVFYRCQSDNCLRCHNPEYEWSSHYKMLRLDGFDASGTALEVEVRRAKRRDTMMVLVDQPVFVLQEGS